MVDRRILVISALAAFGLSGCVAQELKMPWDRSAPAVEAPAQPQAKATPQPIPAPKPAPVVVPPQKPSKPSVADVAAPPVKVEKAAPAPAQTAASAEAQPVVATPTEPAPAKVAEPKPVMAAVAEEPVSAPAPAPQPVPTPADPMAEMREQARAAVQSGEAEVAEALWQLILQTSPDDAEAKQAMAALEEAKLKEAKAQGKVILLGETAAGWVVQVATYRADGREEAFEWLGKIRRAGYKPFLKTVEFPGRTLYRLRLGAYPERWMAEEVERRLLNNFPNEGLRPRIMQQDG
jgi:hypothetical protein